MEEEDDYDDFGDELEEALDADDDGIMIFQACFGHRTCFTADSHMWGSRISSLAASRLSKKLSLMHRRT